MTCRGLLAPRVAAQPFGRLPLLDEVPYRLERRGVRHELILRLDLKRQKLGNKARDAGDEDGNRRELSVGAMLDKD